MDSTPYESVCPGFNTGQCATCDCPIELPDKPKPVAPKGHSPYIWETKHPDDVIADQRERQRRDALRAMRLAIDGSKPVTNQRRRALGELARIQRILAAKTEGVRDADTAKAIYHLGVYVNDGYLTENEVLQAILTASEANGHLRDNKRLERIERDVSIGIAKAATAGEHVDWAKFDE